MGIELHVVPSVYIPKQESELLVTLAKALVRKYHAGVEVRALDLCTGSANIPIALVDACPEIRIDAVELSEHALYTAHENVRRHQNQHRIRVRRGDALRWKPNLSGHYQIITCNPPYDSIEKLEGGGASNATRNYEPREAWDGGEDGLQFIRSLLDQVARLVTPDGFLLVECDAHQGKSVAELCRERPFWRSFQVVHKRGTTSNVLIASPRAGIIFTDLIGQESASVPDFYQKILDGKKIASGNRLNKVARCLRMQAVEYANDLGISVADLGLEGLEKEDIAKRSLQMARDLELKGIVRSGFFSMQRIDSLENSPGSILAFASLLILMDALQNRITRLQQRSPMNHSTLAAANDLLEVTESFYENRPNQFGDRLNPSSVSDWHNLEYLLANLCLQIDREL